MSKDKISDYSATANSNTDIGGINIDEGCAPSGINDAIRTLMKQLKDWQSGSQDVYIHPAGSASVPSITATGDTNTGIFFPAADTIALTTGGSERLRLNSSGNLGLGVTPSAWESSYQVFDIGTNGTVYNYANGAMVVANNLYVTGGVFKYKISSYAPSLYAQSSGQHIWYYAASGTAGNTATLTQAMTLDASGRLGIGLTSPSYIMDVGATGTSNTININGTATLVRLAGSSYGQIASTSTLYLDAGASQPVVFRPNGSTEAARIDSSGNLLVGTASKLSGGIDGLDINTSGETGITFAKSGTVKNYFYLLTDATAFQWQTVSGVAVNIVSNTNGVTLANGGTSWGSLSDERKKDIIEPIENATEKVSTLRAVIGKYKTENDGIRRSMLIAQDVQAVLPEAVTENSNGDLVLQYTDTIPLLVAAIKEQQAIITQLQADVAALKGQA